MLKRFLTCERGNYAMLTAITMVPLMAAVAGVVDYTGTSDDASKLQNALDATGLAIGTKYYSGMTQTELRQLGEQFFAANMLIPTSQDLQIADADRHAPDHHRVDDAHRHQPELREHDRQREAEGGGELGAADERHAMGDQKRNGGVGVSH